jgi:hypothetical protein
LLFSCACLPTLRSLKKEHELYQKEAVDQKLKKDKLIADGVDDSEWEVKNAVRPIQLLRYSGVHTPAS